MTKPTSLLLIAVLIALLLGACRSRSADPTATPQPTDAPAAAAPTATEMPTDTPTVPPPTDTAIPELPTATPLPTEPPPPTVENPAAEPVASLPGLVSLNGTLPEVVEVLPTATPVDDDDLMPVRELGVGVPGHYVNVTYGYELDYPVDWFTGFGNRPVLVSFSNLDPGTTNREGIRAGGCLIEITASTNTYNFNLAALQAQSPKTYEGAQETDLGGVPALLMVRQDTGQAFNSELLQIIAQDRLFLIALEYQVEREAECRPVWDAARASWRWFEPDFVAYKNQIYGYSISHPRRWFLFNPTQQGIFVSSVDPGSITSGEELVRQGMVVHTHVFENPELMGLKEFLTTNIGDLGFTNDISLGTVIGVRSVKDGPAGSQAMVGYYQGPLGRIYAVEIFYPADRIREFRPIANAIIYSFEF